MPFPFFVSAFILNETFCFVTDKFSLHILHRVSHSFSGASNMKSCNFFQKHQGPLIGKLNDKGCDVQVKVAYEASALCFCQTAVCPEAA